MSDPKREKLETEAREKAKRLIDIEGPHSDHCSCVENGTRWLADWAERREREAVAERDREWRAKSDIERKLAVHMAVQAAVAERDKEWSTAVGSKITLTPDVVGSQRIFTALAVHDLVRDAVAEERRALLEWVEANAVHELDGERVVSVLEMLAALAAREKPLPEEKYSEVADEMVLAWEYEKKGRNV